MKSGKRRGLSIIVWMLFVIMTAGIFYLSFQSGEGAKRIDSVLIDNLTDWHEDGSLISREQIDLWIYKVRQSGRVLAFLLLGMVGTLAVQLSFQKWSWILRNAIACMGLAAIAMLTERLKVYIPSRHYSQEEMLLSLAAVAAGFLTVAAASLAFQIVKGMLNPAAKEER